MAHPTADKNFRLSESIRPERYDAQLVIHPGEKRFTGTMTLTVKLANPSTEIVLHAVELTVERAVAKAGGKSITATEITPVEVSQTVILRFPEAIPAGTSTVELSWSGKFMVGLRGLYPAGPIALTQFEASDARRVFPCFDEPAFKARWLLSIDAPKDAAVLANGAAVAESTNGDRRTVTFKETPPLSSYLVAFAVGNMVSSAPIDVRGVPLRTWSVPQKANMTAFAQEVGAAVLPRLEDYFGLPYQFGKVDQLGVSDFEAGAMENVGLITYRETVLLLDPATASLDVKKRVAEVITHELAHQWFGNWVTMVWWDDLWLNEAFATWMAYKIVDSWRPEWRLWLDFGVGTASAMALDALKSTHPIRAEVKNADEATESFDLITYEKGGAVLRMIEGFLSADKFREGIRSYMKTFGQKNAVADDLWTALEQASGQPVLELANAWIRREGFPIVTVSLRHNVLQLTQCRFFSEPGVQGEGSWPVPMVLRFRDNKGVHEQRVLMRGATEQVELQAKGEIKWLTANADASGFYRVGYDADMLRALGDARAELRPSERVSVLADVWAQVRAGTRPLGEFLQLAQQFQGETDYAVLNELVSRFSVIEHRLLDEKDRPLFEKLIEKLFGAQLDAVGWGSESDSDDLKLQRAALLRAVGLLARRKSVAVEAARRLDGTWASQPALLEANLHGTAVALTARDGDQTRFDAFLTRHKAEQEPSFRRRYLMALASFEAPAQVKAALELALSETVPAQDLAGFVTTLMGNRAARGPAWQMIQDRWNDVLARTGNAPMILRRVIESLALLPERANYQSVKQFLTAHHVEHLKAGIAQTLERMEQDTALRDRAMPELSEWLRANVR